MIQQNGETIGYPLIDVSFPVAQMCKDKAVWMTGITCNNHLTGLQAARDRLADE